jgi:lysozyme family protein
MPQDSKLLFATIEAIIDREGGFASHPKDKGGPTKFGITMPTLARWRKRPVTEDDIRDMQRPEAREIYLSYYIIPLADTPSALFPHVADIAVHSGVARAKILRDAALKTENPKVELVKLRLQFLSGLVAKNPSQAVFFKGWVTRCLEFLS